MGKRKQERIERLEGTTLNMQKLLGPHGEVGMGSWDLETTLWTADLRENGSPSLPLFFAQKNGSPSIFRGSSALIEMALESLTDRKRCSSWQATQDQDLLVDIISDGPPQLLFLRSLPCWAGGVWNTSVWMNCCFFLIQNYTPVGHLEI